MLQLPKNPTAAQLREKIQEQLYAAGVTKKDGTVVRDFDTYKDSPWKRSVQAMMDKYSELTTVPMHKLGADGLAMMYGYM